MYHFDICDLADIESVAISYAKNIIAKPKFMKPVVDFIQKIAMSRIEYSRSLAIVTRQIQGHLDVVDTNLALDFRKDLVGAVQSTYIKYWSEYLGHVPQGYHRPSKVLESADPLAISAFMGDLYYARLLSYQELEPAFTYLLQHATSRLHIHCLYALFAHAYGDCQPNGVDVDDLRKCMWLAQERCARHLDMSTIEVRGLRYLFVNLSQPSRILWPDVVDQSLDFKGVFVEFLRKIMEMPVVDRYSLRD